LKRETKLLHSRLDGPGETKPLAVVDPEEILTFDQVCSSSLDVNHGHSVKVSLFGWPRDFWGCSHRLHH
jgi:hypothetical protein